MTDENDAPRTRIYPTSQELEMLIAKNDGRCDEPMTPDEAAKWATYQRALALFEKRGAALDAYLAANPSSSVGPLGFLDLEGFDESTALTAEEIEFLVAYVEAVRRPRV